MSDYNPEFFKANKPSEELLKRAAEKLGDIDPKLKEELLAEFREELNNSNDD